MKTLRRLTIVAAFALYTVCAFAATDAFTGTAATALATHDASWTANTANDGLTGLQLDGSGNLTYSGSNFNDVFYNGGGTGSSSKSHATFPSGNTVPDALGNLLGVGIRMAAGNRGYQCFLKSSTTVATNLDQVQCRCNGTFMNQVTLSPTLNASTTQIEMTLEMNGASAATLTMNGTTYAIDFTNAGIIANCTATVITGGFPGLMSYHNSGTPTMLVSNWTDDAAAGGTVVNPIGGGGGSAARPVTFNRHEPAANDDEFRLRASR